MTQIDNVHIRVAAISNRIVLARLSKKGETLESRDIMSEFWQALVQYSFDGRMPLPGEAMNISFGGGDEQFTCTVKRNNPAEEITRELHAEAREKLKDKKKKFDEVSG